jgi:hypothetical protein
MSTQIDLGPVLSVPKGDWNATTTYERLNLVRHNSASWICNVATSIGVEPTEDSTDWYLQVKDISSVTSVNGMKGDVVIELTETETPPANDNSNRIATTEWVTDKLGDVDLSGIKDDTVLAAQNASSLEVGTGELTSAELAAIIDNNDSALRTLIAEEVAKCLKTSGGTMTDKLDMGRNALDNVSGIELAPAVGSKHGGNIDFHFDGERTPDYTSRIWESERGKVNIEADAGVVINDSAVLTSAGGELSGALYSKKPYYTSIGLEQPALAHPNGGQVWLCPTDSSLNGAVILRTINRAGAIETDVIAQGAQLTCNGHVVYNSTHGYVLNQGNVIAGMLGSAALTLPAGGAWAYVITRADGDSNSGTAGIAAGGTVVNYGGDKLHIYFAVRV